MWLLYYVILGLGADVGLCWGIYRTFYFVYFVPPSSLPSGLMAPFFFLYFLIIPLPFLPCFPSQPSSLPSFSFLSFSLAVLLLGAGPALLSLFVLVPLFFVFMYSSLFYSMFVFLSLPSSPRFFFFFFFIFSSSFLIRISFSFSLSAFISFI